MACSGQAGSPLSNGPLRPGTGRCPDRQPCGGHPTMQWDRIDRGGAATARHACESVHPGPHRWVSRRPAPDPPGSGSPRPPGVPCRCHAPPYRCLPRAPRGSVAPRPPPVMSFRHPDPVRPRPGPADPPWPLPPETTVWATGTEILRIPSGTAQDGLSLTAHTPRWANCTAGWQSLEAADEGPRGHPAALTRRGGMFRKKNIRNRTT